MATRAKSDKSFIAALGPFFIEVIQLSSVSNNDEIESRLANPEFAIMASTADAGGTSTNPSATISGKTITLRDPPTTSCVVVVFGNAMS